MFEIPVDDLVFLVCTIVRGATQPAANDIRETTVNAAAQRLARDRLGERYGELTIGEVLDRYGRSGGPTAGGTGTQA
jgi:hypothetical protein